MNVALFSYTRAFGDGQRNFEPWSAPELAPPPPNYHTNGRKFQLSTDLTCIAALQGGSLEVLGSNSRQVKPRSDTYTTRLPRPHQISNIKFQSIFPRDLINNLILTKI
ncbi:hypothetical protein TNCV_1631551 [Trichonephila clavipes]|nr:hypothetical protein TNCV_1631551 [Trichonephila clavipes]